VNPTTQGVDGDFYINTTTEFIFGPKAGGFWPAGVSIIGPTGATGPVGATGATGADGKTILNGVIAPTGGVGVDGDFYLDTATETIYGPKSSGIWPAGVSLIGPTGPQGIQGYSVLNGTVNPTTQGVDGDFYINTTTSFLFGPKAGGTWPAGVSLVGPTGPQGIQGYSVLNGTVDPTTQGVNGDFYINTMSYFIFGPKAAGVWPGGMSLVGPPGINYDGGTASSVYGGNININGGGA
jgi:hypothetical protein